MPQSNEQRCSQRVLIRRPVEFTQLDKMPERPKILSNQLPNLSNWQYAQLIDLSDCGVGLICQQPGTVNDCWLISLSLPNYDNDAALNLAAKVVRSEKVRENYLVGLEILEPSAHDLIVIHDFFRYHQRFYA